MDRSHGSSLDLEEREREDKLRDERLDESSLDRGMQRSVSGGIQREADILQIAKSILIIVREDLSKLKSVYKANEQLDDREDFESYYRTMKALFDDISKMVKENRGIGEFTFASKVNELVFKHGMLVRKVCALDDDRQSKEFREHFQMRNTDEPTTRKTLKSWVEGCVVDPDNPEQARQDLIKALKCYISIRSAEKKLFEGNKQDKLDSARAMIRALEGDRGQALTLKQLKALTSDDLGGIIKKFQPAVHIATYNAKTDKWDLEATTYGQADRESRAARSHAHPGHRAHHPDPVQRSSRDRHEGMTLGPRHGSGGRSIR